jgi:mono/diheme cytochrome c family protein
MNPETTENHRVWPRLPRTFLHLASRAFAVGVLATLLLTASLLPGSAQSGTPEWLLFIGRFHPLVLHLPIALLVLLPMLHVLARACPAGTIRPVIVLTLWLIAGGALVAAVCGLLLSQESGYAGATLDLHRRFAMVLTVLAALLLVCESESEASPAARLSVACWARNTYRAVLPLALVCLGVTAHLGASLTHGSTFLTDHLPPLLKVRTAASSQPGRPEIDQSDSAYTAIVAPILGNRCVSCHGAEKSKGGLRLHTLDAILAGGDSQRDEHRATVVPGRADESLLVQALCLPESDDAHMPPSGKPQLTENQITMLRWWIDAGASSQVLASKAPGSDQSGAKRQTAPRD